MNQATAIPASAPPHSPSIVRAWPAPLENDALHGPAGKFVRAVEPHSEADMAALLGQFLVAFGSAVGSRPHFMAESDRHGVNLNAVFVGETAKGRKGTSWGHVRRGIVAADPEWGDRIMAGLSSGEGLIWQVRDPAGKIQYATILKFRDRPTADAFSSAVVTAIQDFELGIGGAAR